MCVCVCVCVCVNVSVRVSVRERETNQPETIGLVSEMLLQKRISQKYLN